MYTHEQRKADLRAIAKLGGPLLANNLAITGMTFADTVMAGRLGAVQLAGLAVGAAYWQLFVFIALGILMAVSPSIAHANGANDRAAVVRYLRQAWWLATVVAGVLVCGLLQVSWVLPAIGIAPEILPTAIGYVHAITVGMPAAAAFFALRYASEGLRRTKPIMYIGLSALVLNVFGNWVFMYGKLGMPRMGAVGCGVATAIAFWFMFLAMLVHMQRHRVYRAFDFFARIDRPHLPTILELARIGAPIAGSIVAEGGLFVAAALMMGSMGAVTAGAHQVAVNYASFMFMVPLAVSSAMTIHVGHTLGAGDPARARRVGLLGIGLCAGVMCVSALVIVLFNDVIAALYTSDPPVRELAATLLLMAGLFQLSDGVQIGAAGALRGHKDTAIPLLFCVFSYWIVGFPLAYYLGLVREGGPIYVWLGLIAGLSLSAVLLVSRFLAIAHKN
ncbi:MAG: MATE family efflux transporter [Gammaproteobacteria bacterium]